MSGVGGRASVIVVALALFLALACAEESERPGLPEHPQARATVSELAGSDDPAVQYWGWERLAYMAEGALPALQPLLVHEDPLRQWRAFRILLPFLKSSPERVPPDLLVPDVISFPRSRLAKSALAIAQHSRHSMIIHDGALASAMTSLELKTSPYAPWDDLLAWAQNDEGLKVTMREGILVLGEAAADGADDGGIDPLAPRRMKTPAGAAGNPIESRVMRGRTPAEAMQIVRSTAPGFGMVVLPGAWTRVHRVSYVFTDASWYGAVVALADSSDLIVRWFGHVLVVAAPEDELPESLALEAIPPSKLDPVPTLRRYDMLDASPLTVISALAGRAGLHTVVLPAVREHIESLPIARRPGFEKGEPRPWMRVSFDEIPAQQAMWIAARLLRLEPTLHKGQVDFTVVESSPDEER